MEDCSENDFQGYCILRKTASRGFFLLCPICLNVNNNKSFTPGHSQQASNIHRSCAEGPCGEQRALTQTLASLQKVGQRLWTVYHAAHLEGWGNGSHSSQISRLSDLKGFWAASHILLPVCDVTAPSSTSSGSHDKHITLTHRPHRGQEKGPKNPKQCLIKSADINGGSDRMADDDFVKDRPRPLSFPL